LRPNRFRVLVRTHRGPAWSRAKQSQRNGDNGCVPAAQLQDDPAAAACRPQRELVVGWPPAMPTRPSVNHRGVGVGVVVTRVTRHGTGTSTTCSTLVAPVVSSFRVLASASTSRRMESSSVVFPAPTGPGKAAHCFVSGGRVGFDRFPARAEGPHEEVHACGQANEINKIEL